MPASDAAPLGRPRLEGRLMADRQLAGINVSRLTKRDLLERVDDAFEHRTRLHVTFLNPDYARRALLDDDLREAINAFDVVAVDGNGVRLVAPLFGFALPERLDTDSIAPMLFDLVQRHHSSVFLFGCAPGMAEAARRRLEAEMPHLRVAGTEHGFHDIERGHPGRFSPQDSEAIVARINDSGADLVVVSLPTPLQQKWIVEYGDRLQAPVVMTGGCYLDHLAETTAALGVSWYPGWIDALGLNWLYRLMREPRRLWRRYTIEMVHFLVLVLRARLGRRPRST